MKTDTHFIKPVRCAALLALLLAVFAAVTPFLNMISAEDTNMNTLILDMDMSYGRIRLTWSSEEEGAEADRYTVTLQSVDESGNTEDLISDICDYSYLQADEYVLYACQEHGVPHRMRFVAEGFSGDTKTAEGFSELFDPADLWPEKETLSFGTDIPMETVRYISWDSNGTAAEDNWHYTAACSADGAVLYYSLPGETEREKTLSSSAWEGLLDIISKGQMERVIFSDPTIQELDGGSEDISVSWKDDSRENISSLYRFSSDAGTREELKAWFSSNTPGHLFGWKVWAIGAAVLMLIAAAAIIIIKNRI